MLKTRMTDHLRAIKSSCSPELSIEREFRKGAEYVEDGSVAMRPGAVQHSRYHPVDYSDILSDKTDYPFEVNKAVPFDLPKSELYCANKFHKKEKQNSFELAEPRRLPTACF